MGTTEIDRFWSKVIIKGPGDCWEWTGARVSKCRGKGYGGFKVKRNGSWKQEQAHRFVWEITFGAIPSGLHVLHKCDNSLCENPSHLFLGTNLDNIKDKVSKGRAKGNESSDRRYVPKGVDCSWSRLTENEVLGIKRELTEKKISQAAISRKYGVAPSMICLIKQGKAWNSVK